VLPIFYFCGFCVENCLERENRGSLLEEFLRFFAWDCSHSLSFAELRPYYSRFHGFLFICCFINYNKIVLPKCPEDIMNLEARRRAFQGFLSSFSESWSYLSPKLRKDNGEHFVVIFRVGICPICNFRKV
jgi:hypothetical protein